MAYKKKANAKIDNPWPFNVFAAVFRKWEKMSVIPILVAAKPGIQVRNIVKMLIAKVSKKNIKICNY